MNAKQQAQHRARAREVAAAFQEEVQWRLCQSLRAEIPLLSCEQRERIMHDPVLRKAIRKAARDPKDLTWVTIFEEQLRNQIARRWLAELNRLYRGGMSRVTPKFLRSLGMRWSDDGRQQQREWFRTKEQQGGRDGEK